MIKERKILTWEELANKINQMSPEERKESVKVWGDERNFCDDVFLTKESDDMCYDEQYPGCGCDVRSNFTKDCNLVVALEADKYYLYAY